MSNQQSRQTSNNSNIGQQVQNAIKPFIEQLTKLIEKYSGELVECKICKGNGAKLHGVTGKPLLAQDMSFIICPICNGTGQRRV